MGRRKTTHKSVAKKDGDADHNQKTGNEVFYVRA
jgi:hypothetical protein